MGGQEVIDIRAISDSSAAIKAARAYQRHRIDAATQAMRSGEPISVNDQLKLMTQLIDLADKVIVAVLNEQ